MTPAIAGSFTALLTEPGHLHEVEPGIYSVLSSSAAVQPYDRRAALYDAVVGSRIYNRLMWGVDRRSYKAFAGCALAASTTGWHLDAGCGSLVFTQEVYCKSPSRPCVLVDKSLGMLRAARARLESSNAAARTILLQADLLELPFLPGVFTTVLSMGMLHLFRDPATLMQRLADILAPGGSLWLTSLVRGRMGGDSYFRLLHLTGEVAAPRSAAEIQSLVRDIAGSAPAICHEGNMLFSRVRLAESGLNLPRSARQEVKRHNQVIIRDDE